MLLQGIPIWGKQTRPDARHMTLTSNMPFESDISAMKNSELDSTLSQC